MAIQNYLETKRKIIKTYIQSELNSVIAELDKEFEYRNSLNLLATFALSGKLIRGSAFLLSYEMLGGKNEHTVTPLAAHLELLQSALLIHDDIMDRDNLRRGKPSVHSQYALTLEGKNYDNPQWLGVSLALGLGDVSMFLGQSLLSKIITPSPILRKVINIVYKEYIHVGLAQMDDVTRSNSPKLPELDKIIHLYRYKTARYTYAVPLLCGGILTRQSPDTLKTLELLGENLGIIFQIRDDELGLQGTEEIGKSLFSDIRENKQTLIKYFLYRYSSEGEKDKLQKIFGNGEPDADAIIFINHLCKKHDVREKIDRVIDAHREQVLGAIRKLHISKEYKDLLYDLLEFNIERKK